MEVFSIGSFVVGFLILAAGTLLVVFHQPIANYVMSGISSYEKVKLWGIIACCVGLGVMLGLHAVILNFLFQSLL